MSPETVAFDQMKQTAQLVEAAPGSGLDVYRVSVSRALDLVEAACGWDGSMYHRIRIDLPVVAGWVNDSSTEQVFWSGVDRITPSALVVPPAQTRREVFEQLEEQSWRFGVGVHTSGFQKPSELSETDRLLKWHDWFMDTRNFYGYKDLRMAFGIRRLEKFSSDALRFLIEKFWRQYIEAREQPLYITGRKSVERIREIEGILGHKWRIGVQLELTP